MNKKILLICQFCNFNIETNTEFVISSERICCMNCGKSSAIADLKEYDDGDYDFFAYDPKKDPDNYDLNLSYISDEDYED